MTDNALSKAFTTESVGKWVYHFGGDDTEGDQSLKDLLGGKGANLAEMAKMGLPVPAGFTITTDICNYFYENNKTYPSDLETQVLSALHHLEQKHQARFGDKDNPLLLSVRSGARASMPGMMDTILNLGLNDETVKGLAQKSNNPRFAYDSYRRFMTMFSDVVLDIHRDEFEDILETFKRRHNIIKDTDVSADNWQEIIADYKALVLQKTKAPFPQDPYAQLWAAIGAVFASWMTARAVTYRKLNDIPQSWGTAVNIQTMVFGNMGNDCATGVAFTRNPSTGENIFYGEYLINAQGEDVVAGIRTPEPIQLLETMMPDAYHQLLAVRDKLEKHYNDMQDIEFTIQNNKLYMLQTRSGKRTIKAALKIACDMVDEGLIDKEVALLRIPAQQLDQLLHPSLDPKAPRLLMAKGLPASPGAVTGEIVFDADTAEKKAKDGIDVILCRVETSPEDIHGMHAAKGILTTRGGMTSHAAVVARGMGRACVAGASEITIDYKTQNLSVKNKIFKAGDVITLDGSIGEIYEGRIATVAPEMNDDFKRVMLWADEARRLKIRANAETPTDAQTARDLGAEGIGLCRTEHMFFDETRILNVRQMIMADHQQERIDALTLLEGEQEKDFLSLFTIMAGLPVTIRLLDPPLHEFLPHHQSEIENFAKNTKRDISDIKRRIERLHEANPMLGHRGLRLAITYPEIYAMQTRAIINAAIAAEKQNAQPPLLEIMIPLTAWKKEFDMVRENFTKTSKVKNHLHHRHHD
jgi:pyruvate,orthophosphate dikinase